MLDWMHWTWQSGIAFLLLAGLLVGLAILDQFHPGYSRKGFLPMATTRGDRVFLSIVTLVALLLLQLKFLPDESSWWVLACGAVTSTLIMRRA
jgi:predicted small integral membrane protein